MKLRESYMNKEIRRVVYKKKKEWQEHCKWLDTFRGRIVTDNPVYKDYGKKEKKDEKKKAKKS